MPTRADDIIIRYDRRPGDEALIVDLHREGYRAEGDRFGASFAPYVAQTIAEAPLDAPGTRVWFAEMNGRAVGCAAMVDRGDRGQLRWVVLLPAARGRGAGKELLARALRHAEEMGWREVFLETTDGLDASMAMYAALGFEIVSDTVVELWQGTGSLIVMRKRL